MAAPRIDLTGRQFGLLRVIAYAGRQENGKHAWLVRCACGKEKVVLASNLTGHKTQSCGCSRRAARGRRTECLPVEHAEPPKIVRTVNPCYNVYCEFRNNRSRGGVWSCTNQKICPDCQRVRSSEKGERHDK